MSKRQSTGSRPAKANNDASPSLQKQQKIDIPIPTITTTTTNNNNNHPLFRMTNSTTTTTTTTDASAANNNRYDATSTTTACLTDGVLLTQQHQLKSDNNKMSSTNDDNYRKVILPWMGFGTYKLGGGGSKKKEQEEDDNGGVIQTILNAIACGYRCFDTAFIYGGETTERLVGQAIQIALQQQSHIQQRSDIFIITKQWRKYHGYDKTLRCLQLSLKRLRLSYIDLYLIHWPGPAWKTMNRRNDIIETHGPWYYAADHCQQQHMVHVRSETWRAMEDAMMAGKVRRIGVSNFSVEHLKTLKKTATIWPPAVNQIEFHPLYPQTELLEYCKQEGIVIQAYASLGGQDTGKKQWLKLGLKGLPSSSSSSPSIDKEKENGEEQKNGNNTTKTKRPKQKKLKDSVVSLMKSKAVVSLAQKKEATSAQVLLSWALSQNCAVIPKASSMERMKENAGAMNITLTSEEVAEITNNIQSDIMVKSTSQEEEEEEGVVGAGRLCWRRDPLRHLDFD